MLYEVITGLTWRVSPPPEARGRTVLLLDDILDHGKTLRAIRDELLVRGATQVVITSYSIHYTKLYDGPAADVYGVCMLLYALLTGNGSDNVLNAGGGDDSLVGGTGDDTLYGGAVV